MLLLFFIFVQAQHFKHWCHQTKKGYMLDKEDIIKIWLINCQNQCMVQHVRTVRVVPQIYIKWFLLPRWKLFTVKLKLRDKICGTTRTVRTCCITKIWVLKNVSLDNVSENTGISLCMKKIPKCWCKWYNSINVN